MQNPPLFDGFAGGAIKTRVAGGRLPNVRQMRTAFDTLPVEDASVDVVTWILGPHELWFQPEGAELRQGDRDSAGGAALVPAYVPAILPRRQSAELLEALGEGLSTGIAHRRGNVDHRIGTVREQTFCMLDPEAFGDRAQREAAGRETALQLVGGVAGRG